jgi:type II secretion system protein C
MSKIGVKPSEGGEGGGGGPSGSDFKVTLRATMVADPVIYSAAFFMKEGDTYAHAYGIGQEILGAKILAIEAERVKVLRNGVEEWITKGGVQEAEKPAAADAATTTTEGVEALSETEYNVSKALLDANLGNLDELSKLGRALLHRGADGEYDGYRLSAIRRGSLAEQLGIRNGDIIHSVNGTSLNSVQGAMAAFQSLQGGTSPGAGFKFEVTRRGQPVTLSYNVK